MGMDSQGFTLIELLIAVAIIALLAGIAYPGYTGQVKKVYRVQVVALLSEQAQHLQRFYTRNGTFIDAGGVSTGNDHYRISAVLNPHDFVLLATPAPHSVMADDACGQFSLTSTGMRSNPGAVPQMPLKACWGQ
ncbi:MULTISPECIES: type IV pilin protein [Pseudomonas]|jgi:type IV pilus assembly protein PilE|uniref:Type IV pilin protein n=1 Tax=Pseudomonas orientalis TaxID=76758 RepID=A0A4Q7CY01_9PSED|nr:MULTISPECIES: type IV pilin protein [Pseudomonas]POM11809.1 type IV pilin protein [Pseudomonas sp. WP001]MBY8929556.1 type IV pilin protein [Pseudomonas sp. Wu6]RZI30358.1 type IV pilin protein [Pseudomonas orientalis]CRM14770.1 putative major pilin subunit [Pseudomonas sp. 44 R 15]CRM39141.1 putative major pilin subunit [Pseudomonas sp. 24 E 13]